jgi:hypothetical protein
MPSAIEQLARDGFVSLDAPELSARSSGAGLLVDSVPASLKLSAHRFVVEGWDGYAMTVLTNPQETSDEFRGLMQLASRTLEGAGFGSNALEGAYVVSKHATCGLAVGWHQDVALDVYRANLGGRRITAWIPLQDTDAKNGGLSVFAATHLCGIFRHQDVRMKRGPAQRSIVHLPDLGRPIALTTPAGSITVLHERVVHGSHANLADLSRHALVADFVSLA